MELVFHLCQISAHVLDLLPVLLNVVCEEERAAEQFKELFQHAFKRASISASLRRDRASKRSISVLLRFISVRSVLIRARYSSIRAKYFASCLLRPLTASGLIFMEAQ